MDRLELSVNKVQAKHKSQPSSIENNNLNDDFDVLKVSAEKTRADFKSTAHPIHHMCKIHIDRLFKLSAVNKVLTKTKTQLKITASTTILMF